MRIRSLAMTMTLLAGGAAIGATTQHLASADDSGKVSSGERPVLISIEPCRLADTRPGTDNVGPRSAPLAAADTHTIDAQQPDTPCSGGIPTDATALSLNVTALGASELSYLTIWADGPRPTAASLNPAPGQPPVPNAVTTALSADQRFNVYNNAGNVHIVVDVNGYYVDHDHDDRYYTKDQGDARYVVRSTPPPDSIRVPSIEAKTTGTWSLGLTMRTMGAGSPCLYVPIEGQDGRYATAVDITYDALAPVSASAAVVSTIADEGITTPGNGYRYHLVDFSVGLPSTGGDEFQTESVPHDPTEAVTWPIGVPIEDDGWDVRATICFSDAVSVSGFEVHFSDSPA